MFSPKKALLSAVLCAALTAPSQASYNPDEGTSTNSTSVAVPPAPRCDPKVLKNPMLAPWMEILNKDAPAKNLILACQMLDLQNVARLGMNGLLEQLTSMEDKTKALALAAHAAQIFTAKMDAGDQRWLLDALLNSPQNLQECIARGTAAKVLFTEKMKGWDQAKIIDALLKSPNLLPECIARGTAAKVLFTDKMDGWDQRWLIEILLASPLRPQECIARGTAAKVLFTDKMTGWNQVLIIQAVLESPQSLQEYIARGIAAKVLFTDKMDGDKQRWLIIAVSSLSDAQLAKLVSECARRPGDDFEDRQRFIESRAKALLAGK